MLRFTLLTLSAVIVSLSIYGQNVDKTFYPTGELESEFIKTDSCDYYYAYYKNGQKMNSAKYLHSGLFGTYIDGDDFNYFDNGVVATYTFWKNKKPEGRQYSNYKNGQLGYEQFYKNGYRTGTWKYYEEDGTIFKKIVFGEKGSMWGTPIDHSTDYYYRNGKLAYIETIEGGKVFNTEIKNQSLYQAIQDEKSKKKNLFIANCATCHTIKKDAVGPKLQWVVKMRDYKWLKKMIWNGDQLVKENDSLAVSLYNKWGKTKHPNFERLTEEEVEKIIEYIGSF